jgi:periplasmic divalent cation tolerance protein
MTTDCVVALITCSSVEEGRKVAHALLDARIAACVNIAAHVESHYWWKGKKESANEVLLTVKTQRRHMREVAKVVKANHSYEVPEVIFLPILAGERNYLKWVRESCKKITIFAAIFAVSTAVFAANFDEWVKKLSDSDEEIRVSAIESLANLGDDRAIDALAKRLNDSSMLVRAAAADAIAQIGGPKAEKVFEKSLGSTNPEVRQMAIVGLTKVTEGEFDVELVKARLKDSNSMVRWSAAFALGMSPYADVLPALEEAAKSDESESVREAAAESLQKLQKSVLWQRSYDDAMRQARALNRPVMIYFYIRGSEFCHKLEEGPLRAPQIVQVSQELVCVKLNAATSEHAQKFDVRGAPTILLVDARGNEMERIAGLVDAEKLAERLDIARRGKMSFRALRQHAARHPEDVQANWRLSEYYLDEGREDLAIPLLENVVNHDPENKFGYQARALFALGYCLGKSGQHARAAYTLEHLLEKFVGFPDKDKALYCWGLSLAALGKRQQAAEKLEQIVREFPDSAAARSAKVALERMKNE